MTVQIEVNGESRHISNQMTLDQLLTELELAPERIAVEHNRAVVSRRDWSQTHLTEGDRIEIVHFVGGGSIKLKTKN